MANIAMMAISNTLQGLRREITLSKTRERTRQCTEAVLSTALAIVVSHRLGLQEIWWPAICAFSLTGLALRPALRQGAQQIAGTVCGVALGWVLSQYVAAQVGLFVLSIMCVSAGGLYLATSRAASYLWILSTVLAIFMIAAVHAHPSTKPESMALTLCAGAAVGTVAYCAVCALSQFVRFARGRRDAVTAAAAASAASSQPDTTLGRLRHTLAGAVTLSVLAFLAYRYPLEGFAQAMTTALVTLLVPLDVSGAWSPYAVVLRMFHRLLGCLIGSALVVVLLPLTAGNMLYCVVALSVLIWLACHLRFGGIDVSYAGTQFGAVAILAFVHDKAWFSDDVQAAYSRLVGIASGIAILAVVLALVSRAISGWPLGGARKRMRADGG